MSFLSFSLFFLLSSLSFSTTLWQSKDYLQRRVSIYASAPLVTPWCHDTLTVSLPHAANCVYLSVYLICLQFVEIHFIRFIFRWSLWSLHLSWKWAENWLWAPWNFAPSQICCLAPGCVAGQRPWASAQSLCKNGSFAPALPANVDLSGECFCLPFKREGG